MRRLLYDYLACKKTVHQQFEESQRENNGGKEKKKKEFYRYVTLQVTTKRFVLLNGQPTDTCYKKF